MLRLSNVSVPLDYDKASLTRLAAKKLNARVSDVHIAKKSVDARDKSDVHFVMALDVHVMGEEQALLSHPPRGVQLSPVKPEGQIDIPRISRECRPLVVGLGPAGLFAAYTLALGGMNPLVIERGQPVDERRRSVDAFWSGGPLDEQSNVQFGEGGAGAFSDGKLNTGISDPRCRFVLNTLHECGAPEEILYQAKPHIGTDRLPGVVKALRERIISLGGQVVFGTRLTGILSQDGQVAAARLTGPGGIEQEVPVSRVILAVGHSARDTFDMLNRLGVTMTQKPFSIGARIEHSQRMIDLSQYGRFAGHPALGAADYKLSAKTPTGRGVYTFCMCPGGQVVAAASQRGGVVTNGMSAFARDGQNANSALLVGIDPSDFGGSDPLAGVRLQETWERAAFDLGGGNYHAPAQTVADFLQGTKTLTFGDVAPSYRPGVVGADLSDCLPDYAVEAMRWAIQRMDRQLHGFMSPGAVLTGVETRSSSPVRINRGEDGQASLKGLYPCGEGAGYAGGILSAAVDGIRMAQAVMAQI